MIILIPHIYLKSFKVKYYWFSVNKKEEGHKVLLIMNKRQELIGGRGYPPTRAKHTTHACSISQLYNLLLKLTRLCFYIYQTSYNVINIVGMTSCHTIILLGYSLFSYFSNANYCVRPTTGLIRTAGLSN